MKRLRQRTLKASRVFIVAAQLLLTTTMIGCASKDAGLTALDRMHYEKFKQEEAAAAQDEATKKSGRPVMTAPEYEALGDRYYQQGSLEMAFVQYQKALLLNPEGGAQLHYKRGQLFLGRGMSGEAIQEFQLCLKQQPQNAGAHEGMGQALLRTGQYENARKHVEEALRIDSTRWQAYNLLGMIYEYEKQYEMASQEYENAIALNPGEPQLYNNLGVCCAMMGEYQKALEVLTRGLTNGNKVWEEKLYNNLGLVLGKLGRYPEALEAFKHGGDEAQAYNNLGCLYLEKGDYKSAAACFQQATELRTSFYAKANENLKKARRAIGGSASPLEWNPGR